MKLALVILAAVFVARADAEVSVTLGPRPNFLVQDMAASDLKTTLQSCLDDKTMQYEPHDFSIGHRGACMQFPEVRESPSEALGVWDHLLLARLPCDGASLSHHHRCFVDGFFHNNNNFLKKE